MDPLLSRIEALPQDGCYSVRFLMDDGQERSIVMRTDNGSVDVPDANLLDNWSRTSESFRAAMAAVRAVHEARELAGAGRPRLRDIDGGWDVAVGNVAISEAGRPVCVAHSTLEPAGSDSYLCAVCGAAALFSD